MQGTERYSEEQHLQKAKHNLDFCEEIAEETQRYCDWQVTAIFYAALHTVQAYFAIYGEDYPSKHADRKYLIKRDRRLKRISHDYEDLKNTAETARYKCIIIDNQDVVRSREQLQKICDHIADLST